jgi:hypothetical protein
LCRVGLLIFGFRKARGGEAAQQPGVLHEASIFFKCPLLVLTV